MRPEPRLLFGHDAQVAEWVSDRLKTLGGDGTFGGDTTAIGIFDGPGTRIIAGVVYHDYRKRPGTVSMTIASESPMFATRNTIKALLHYPFMQLGCQKVWVATLQKNARAQRFLRGVGFKSEAVLRHQFGHKRHAVIFGLLKSEYLEIYGH